MAAALLVLALLAGVLISLCYGGWPALKEFRFGFLTETIWNPVTEHFGALAALYGTVITSLIAMLLAVPVAFGIAVFLTETCPLWLRGPIATCIELLAAVPSIVFGIWGLFVLAPVLQHSVQPWLIDVLGDLPVIGKLFRGPPYGIGLLTAGFVLAVMVLPFITSVMREVFLCDAALAQGSRLRARRHAVGSHLGCGAAQLPRRRHRRHHARSRPRARRDHGRDIRGRQRAPHRPARCWRRARPSPPASPMNSPRRSASSIPHR